jgi:hypothetical protein
MKGKSWIDLVRATSTECDGVRASAVHFSLTNVDGYSGTTFVRTLRRSLSTEKMFVVGMIGLVAAAGHNTLACLLSNLRVKEFERRSLGDQQAPEDAYPRTALPTFWDGFAVGCIGSVMDADLPQQPAHRYLGMRCGW